MPSAFRIGSPSPLAGSRRLTSALKTVPKPITANAIVIEALGASGLSSSGPATSGTSAATKSAVAYTSHRVMARRLVIGTRGSRGGRFITCGSPGSSAITTTPATVTKNSR